jgi:hypothetical protein
MVARKRSSDTFREPIRFVPHLEDRLRRNAAFLQRLGQRAVIDIGCANP